jgi:hypothetical protein
MELPPEQPTLTLHTERVTISGDRYLIYYTFTTPEEADISQEDEQPNV